MDKLMALSDTFPRAMTISPPIPVERPAMQLKRTGSKLIGIDISHFYSIICENTSTLLQSYLNCFDSWFHFDAIYYNHMLLRPSFTFLKVSLRCSGITLVSERTGI